MNCVSLSTIPFVLFRVPSRACTWIYPFQQFSACLTVFFMVSLTSDQIKTVRKHCQTKTDVFFYLFRFVAFRPFSPLFVQWFWRDSLAVMSLYFHSFIQCQQRLKRSYINICNHYELRNGNESVNVCNLIKIKCHWLNFSLEFLAFSHSPT